MSFDGDVTWQTPTRAARGGMFLGSTSQATIKAFTMDVVLVVLLVAITFELGWIRRRLDKLIAKVGTKSNNQ